MEVKEFNISEHVENTVSKLLNDTDVTDIYILADRESDDKPNIYTKLSA